MRRTITLSLLLALGLLAAESCKGPTGPQGASGTDGTDGTNGTNGMNGTNGVANYVVVTQDFTFDNDPLTDPTDAPLTFNLLCPTGTKALGGGFSVPYPVGPVPEFSIFDNRPLTDGSAWRVSLFSGPHIVATVTVYATCATAS
jgi:hypothetical protein